ncbi:YSC84-related protein [Tropicimonas isoalkanivorans]|uniref:Las17-binding protein actin regulator n=1 Tax=Tropicimonas isoalkanivorans TaxID=441112 RepID=A0A1I1E8A8_9RHOB|nr:YSC84-related protein [Tropicimonas isoalkanivorans]SFB82936.1 Las17-binding protein actin regulator [Tropicimonas isoalkanivorans]
MTSQTSLSRRGFLAVAAAGTAALAGCANGVGSDGAARIDQRVDATRNFLFSTYPGTADLEQKSSGVLYMPLITKAGFGVGGSYGTGALRINNMSVDYYEAIQANVGFQIGAQQYAHALFFMTPETLQEFRTSHGWTAGADAEYAWVDQGGNLSAGTLTTSKPVIALVFAQAGLIAGATLEGTKYRRIIP